jgi:hypothetical protein
MAKACEERERLTEQFGAALQAYIDSVKSLEGISMVEFERSYQPAQETLVRFTAVRAHLMYHLASHGCNDED